MASESRLARSGSRWCSPNAAQCLAQQVLDGRVVQALVAAELEEHGTSLTLAKAEVTKRAEDLGVGVYRARRDRVAIGRAVGMLDVEAVGGRFDDELAAMACSVVGGAQRDEVFEGILAALGTGPYVVHVDEVAVPASGDAATVAIASEDAAA